MFNLTTSRFQVTVDLAAITRAIAMVVLVIS